MLTKVVGMWLIGTCITMIGLIGASHLPLLLAILALIQALGLAALGVAVLFVKEASSGTSAQ